MVSADDAGNTSDRRALEDDTGHTLLKHYLVGDEIRDALPAGTIDGEYRTLEGLRSFAGRPI